MRISVLLTVCLLITVVTAEAKATDYWCSIDTPMENEVYQGQPPSALWGYDDLGDPEDKAVPDVYFELWKHTPGASVKVSTCPNPAYDGTNQYSWDQPAIDWNYWGYGNYSLKMFAGGTAFDENYFSIVPE